MTSHHPRHVLPEQVGGYYASDVTAVNTYDRPWVHQSNNDIENDDDCRLDRICAVQCRRLASLPVPPAVYKGALAGLLAVVFVWWNSPPWQQTFVMPLLTTSTSIIQLPTSPSPFTRSIRIEFRPTVVFSSQPNSQPQPQPQLRLFSLPTKQCPVRRLPYERTTSVSWTVSVSTTTSSSSTTTQQMDPRHSYRSFALLAGARLEAILVQDVGGSAQLYLLKGWHDLNAFLEAADYAKYHPPPSYDDDSSGTVTYKTVLPIASGSDTLSYEIQHDGLYYVLYYDSEETDTDNHNNANNNDNDNNSVEVSVYLWESSYYDTRDISPVSVCTVGQLCYMDVPLGSSPNCRLLESTWTSTSNDDEENDVNNVDLAVAVWRQRRTGWEWLFVLAMGLGVYAVSVGLAQDLDLDGDHPTTPTTGGAAPTGTNRSYGSSDRDGTNDPDPTETERRFLT